MTSVLRAWPSAASIAAARLVFTSSSTSASTTVTWPSRIFCVRAARSAPRTTFRGSA